MPFLPRPEAFREERAKDALFALATAAVGPRRRLEANMVSWRSSVIPGERPSVGLVPLRWVCVSEGSPWRPPPPDCPLPSFQMVSLPELHKAYALE